MNLEMKCKWMAEQIMFSKKMTTTDLKELMDKYDLEFRKNKGVPDINKAMQKAVDFKRGRGKTEFEIDWFALYLRTDVFKEKRVKKVG